MIGSVTNRSGDLSPDETELAFVMQVVLLVQH